MVSGLVGEGRVGGLRGEDKHLHSLVLDCPLSSEYNYGDHATPNGRQLQHAFSGFLQHLMCETHIFFHCDEIFQEKKRWKQHHKIQQVLPWIRGDWKHSSRLRFNCNTSRFPFISFSHLRYGDEGICPGRTNPHQQGQTQKMERSNTSAAPPSNHLINVWC